MAINTGLANITTVAELSNVTACSVISTALCLGYAKRKSADISSDFDLSRPGSLEKVLATAVTSTALERALKRTAALSATATASTTPS
jgi:hypothetical protein